MRGLFSFLMFAAFFYLMMRYGCGAHMVHGGPGGHAGHSSAGHEGHAAQDPVCGMNVAPGEGYSKMVEGREYRFCSKNCLDQFEREPQRHAS